MQRELLLLSADIGDYFSIPCVLNWMPVLQAKVLRQENKPLLFDTLNMYSLIYIIFNLVFILYWSVVWLKCCIEN